MTNYQLEEKARLKKHSADLAIQLAMQNRWEDAVGANQAILELYPNDVDALNRLGRAMTELGRYEEARENYQRARQLDPLNTIAAKNLARLSALKDAKAPKPASAKVDPSLFTTEPGKSGMSTLVRVAPRDMLAKMTVGDKVALQVNGRALLVTNSRGDLLGQVEPKLAQRLISLMAGGNQYVAAINTLDEKSVKVVIRETYQDPSQVGKVSFPSKGDTSGVRPYTKVRLDNDDDDDDDENAIDDHEHLVDADTDDVDTAADPAEFEDDTST